MRTIEERLSRLERMFSKMAFSGAPSLKKRITEAEACAMFGVGKSRLRQLRLGYKGNKPVLKNWTTTRGRRPEYDVTELERYFKKQKPITTEE